MLHVNMRKRSLKVFVLNCSAHCVEFVLSFGLVPYLFSENGIMQHVFGNMGIW